MKVNQQTVVYGLIGMAGAYFLGKFLIKDAAAEVGQVASRVGAAINPTSDQNIFYRGVNAIGAAVSGDEKFNLGSWTYDVLHPSEADQLASAPLMIRRTAPAESSTTPWINWGVGTQSGTRAPVTKTDQISYLR